jgi:hypothetical protein
MDIKMGIFAVAFKLRSVTHHSIMGLYSSNPGDRNWQIENRLDFGQFLAVCFRNPLAGCAENPELAISMMSFLVNKNSGRTEGPHPSYLQTCA